jgi:hypothetical protein
VLFSEHDILSAPAPQPVQPGTSAQSSKPGMSKDKIEKDAKGLMHMILVMLWEENRKLR